MLRTNNENTMVARDLNKQLEMVNDNIHYLQTLCEPVKKRLEDVKTRASNLEAQVKTHSYAHIEVSQPLTKQLAMARRSTEYLRSVYDQADEKLQAAKRESEQLKKQAKFYVRFVDIANTSLESQWRITASDLQDCKKEYNDAQEAITEQEEYGENLGGKQKRIELLKNKIQILESLEKDLHKMKDVYQEKIEGVRDKEKEYADKMDEQRRELRKQKGNLEQGRGKLETLMEKGSKENVNWLIKGGKEYKKLKYSIEDILEEMSFEEAVISKKIKKANENIKKFDSKIGAMKHPYFLNEHIINESEIPEEDLAPESGHITFSATDESACLPTAIRMIRGDEDSNAKDKVLETAQALENYSAAGVAYLSDVPGALQKLGHSVPYEAIEIGSIYDMLDKVTFDRYGKCVPFIIDIHRFDPLKTPGHVVVCNRIVDIKGEKCAVLRDSYNGKRFAVRLDHIDEVLHRSLYAMPKDRFESWLKSLPKKSYHDYLERLPKSLAAALEDGTYSKYFWPNVVVPATTPN